jgi:hypothetical protein
MKQGEGLFRPSHKTAQIRSALMPHPPTRHPALTLQSPSTFTGYGPIPTRRSPQPPTRRPPLSSLHPLMTHSHLFKWAAVAAIIWHAVALLAYAWPEAQTVRHGRDFASYYYAAQVASNGGDPYDKTQLADAARQDKTRSSVHPFFYPPAFLMVVAWAPQLSLATAFQLWFWMGELAALACLLSLWRWVRPLDPSAATLTVTAFALCTAVMNNHLMGQANFLMMALVLAALWAEDRKRSTAAGVLLGLAVLMKMSPALFVLLWMVERRWRAVVATIVTYLSVSVVAASIWGPSLTVHFYTEVLPGFGSGHYNGLRVPIQLFGNHSLPNLWHQWWPALGPGLSAPATFGSALSALVLVGATLWLSRYPTPSRLAQTARWCAVAMVMLLIPVYTYEHHLIWAWPAVVVTAIALFQGKLSGLWRFTLPASWIGWALSLKSLKSSAISWENDGWPTVAWALQEWKMASCIVLWLALMLLVYRDRPRQPNEAPLG